jgi:hypothetical protein
MKILRRIGALFVALATAALLSAGLASTATAAPPTRQAVAVPITGTAPGQTFAGTLNIERFTGQNGQLAAVGTVVGTLTNTTTGALTPVNQAVTMPVNLAQSAASCEILDLVLGPLDLNLLGLTVHLDTVHLNITAVPGAGNLLGNLLCAVAGLLDGPSPLNGVAALLNRLLAILG